MVCNNAVVEWVDDHYRITLPPDKQKEKNDLLRQAVEKYNGYIHIEISKVKKPKSIEQNNLFHAILGEYFLSGLHSYSTWDELKANLKYRYGGRIQVGYKMKEGAKVVVLKSVGDYNTEELWVLTDSTIKEALIAGLDTKKFHKILEEIKYEI